MQTIISLWLFVFCLNVGLYFVGNVLHSDVLLTSTIDPNKLIANYTAIVNATATGQGFNPVLIFGDFMAAIGFFLQLFAGGYLTNMIEVLCFNCSGIEYFTLPLQVILGFLNVIGIISLLRGVNII